jgi:hypothetical protein
VCVCERERERERPSKGDGPASMADLAGWMRWGGWGERESGRRFDWLGMLGE